MIATGTYGSQLQPSVRLWVAEEDHEVHDTNTVPLSITFEDVSALILRSYLRALPLTLPLHS